MTNKFNFDKDWNYREPEQTHDKFLQYLLQAETNPDKEYHAQLLTQIARTQSLQHNWEKAIDYLNISIVYHRFTNRNV